MKRLLLTLGIMAFAAAILVSCGSDVVCEVSEIAIGEKATRDSFKIQGVKSCEVIFAPEWLQVSTNENVVYYSASANTSDEPRESCVVLECSGEQIVLPVVQGIKPSYLVVSKSKVEFEREGGTKRVAALTDGGMLTFKSSIPELKVTREGNYLLLTAEKNDGMKRLGTVKITSGKLAKSISVSIAGDTCPTCNSTGYLKCKRCGGKGWTSWNGLAGGFITACTACGGRGESVYSMRHGDRSYRDGSGRTPCPTCNAKKK